MHIPRPLVLSLHLLLCRNILQPMLDELRGCHFSIRAREPKIGLQVMGSPGDLATAIARQLLATLRLLQRKEGTSSKNLGFQQLQQASKVPVEDARAVTSIFDSSGRIQLVVQALI